jgi:hypothetical protein
MRESVIDDPPADGAFGDPAFDRDHPETDATATFDPPIAPATFVRGYPQVLSGTACEDIIRRFDLEAHTHPERLTARRNPPGQFGTVLELLHHPEWAYLSRSITEITWICLDDYARRYPSLQSLAQPEHCRITRPVIERIEPGPGHGYHLDGEPGGGDRPFLSGLLYLRDGCADGQTEFPFQRLQVQPRAGTMLLFPAFWTHLHRRVSPRVGPQYSLTNQVLVRLPPGAEAV